jgi:hypothetical protein
MLRLFLLSSNPLHVLFTLRPYPLGTHAHTPLPPFPCRPNQQGLALLLTEVLPAIRALATTSEVAARFKLHVVGANDMPEWLQEVMAEEGDMLVYHGHLSEEWLAALYGEVKVGGWWVLVCGGGADLAIVVIAIAGHHTQQVFIFRGWWLTSLCTSMLCRQRLRPSFPAQG